MGKEGVRLVDTRRPVDFRGGARGVLRTGHIPGAINLPFATIIDETLCYVPAGTLRERFAAAGIEEGDDIIAYCYKGRAACMVYIAGSMLGYTVHVYDGSSEEWCGKVELPLEVSVLEGD